MSAAKSQKPLPISQWPEMDRRAWLSACMEGDVILGSGAAADWAPRSRDNAEAALGRFLGYLRRNGRLSSASRPGNRLDEYELCAFGRELAASGLAPYTVLGIFASLGMGFAAIDPEADRSCLNKLISRLDRTATSVRDIQGNLLSPSKLRALGLAMMDDAERLPRRSFRRASLYRDGLLTMFMSLCPLRPGAVSEMQLGEHIFIHGERVTVHLPPEERKKRRIETVPLTDELSRRFIRYITFYRPMLAPDISERVGALWLSRNGKPLNRDSISKRIKERIGRRTGKRFSAHMFRHAAASYVVDMAPERARMITGLLGHSGFRTAKRHYIKGQQHMAVRKYQASVQDICTNGRRSKTTRR